MILIFKSPFLKKFVMIVWKRDNKENHFTISCYSPTNTLTIYIMTLVAPILLLKGVIGFILVFEMVQWGYIMLNLWELGARLLIHSKNLFVKQNANLKISLSIYKLILKDNLLIKPLKNIQLRKILNESTMHFIPQSKMKRQNALIISRCFQFDLS